MPALPGHYGSGYDAALPSNTTGDRILVPGSIQQTVQPHRKRLSTRPVNNILYTTSSLVVPVSNWSVSGWTAICGKRINITLRARPGATIQTDGTKPQQLAYLMHTTARKRPHEAALSSLVSVTLAEAGTTDSPTFKYSSTGL